MSAAMTEGLATNRPTRFEFLAIGLVALFLVLLAADGLRRGHILNGDSVLLVRGARQVLECISDGVLEGCGWIPDSVQTEVGPFPLLQYLPAMALHAIGLGEEAILRALAGLNWIALTGSVIALWLAFWRENAHRWLGPIAVLILISGPVAYFATTAFGEMLAGAAVLAAVIAAYFRFPAWTFLFVVLATIAKETMAPFVLGLAVVGVLVSADRSNDKTRSVVLSAALGTALGVAANLAFNVFRFSTVRNLNYLDPMLRVPDSATAVNFFAMLNVAPGGGLLYFWPLAFALAWLVVFMALVRFFAAPRQWRRWLPSAVLAGVFLGFEAGLSLWYSPFGWISWGPRLLVPIMPAVIFLGLLLLASPATRLARRVFSGPAWPIVLIGLVSLLVALPQWAGPWTHQDVIGTIIIPDETCPPVTEVIIQDGPDPYYRCMTHVAWRVKPSWVDDALTAGGGMAWAARILGSLSVVALLGAAFQRFRIDHGVTVDARV